jgi:hypothetical protein
MISFLVTILLSSHSAYCTTASRNETLLVIKDSTNGNFHFIHMLENEDAKCNQIVNRINNNTIKFACGCKQLIYPGMRDRIRLKCAYLPRQDKIISWRVAVYYYYDDGRSQNYCNLLRDKIINYR